MASRENAYAPYSAFRVGVALMSSDGHVYNGCNVENASYGLSLCAERSAISAAVCAGAKSFVAMAVISNSDDYCIPCGACRQVLMEFSPECTVMCCKKDGSHISFTVRDLLPHSFKL